MLSKLENDSGHVATAKLEKGDKVKIEKVFGKLFIKVQEICEMAAVCLAKIRSGFSFAQVKGHFKYTYLARQGRQYPLIDVLIR